MTHAPRSQRYAVAYDITDDRERAKVDKVLKGWGHRIQKSVFLVTLSRATLARLQAELERVKPETGSILLLRLQGGSDILSIGIPTPDPDDPIAFVV